MGTTASSLPYSIDNQVGAPHDNNGWAVHNGKSTDGTDRQVTVFVGKKPALAKTPCSQRYPSQTQLQPALHHFQYCKRLRHPQILTVHATLDTDNPSSATMDGGSGGPGRPSAPSSSTSSNATTGDLIVVTEPCVSLNQWLLGNPTPEQLAWGLQCVVEALSFLHTSANLSHGAVSPTSFYVTPSGDVKLWNFALVTPVGPNNVGPNPHFEQYDQACCAETYRSPERVQKQYGTTIANGGVHAMDAFSLGVLIDYWYSQAGRGGLPQQLVKAVQRLQSPNPKMRPRKLQSLLTCPVFDTPYQKMQLQLQEIQIQPVEQKVALWQQLGLDFQNQGGGSSNHQKIPKDVALHKILPLVVTECQTITNNESLLAQDMYRREGMCPTRVSGRPIL
jgi:SCY1-like protein 1